jgi:hypothetical protein
MDNDPGLSEIDWEWLIADPEIIYIGTWTGPRGKPERIRWWMIHPQTADTIVLWDYHGSQLGIPQNHTQYRLNF